MMGLRGGISAALVGLAACGAPPPPDPWTLWTIDTLAKRGDPAIVPAGARLQLLSSPYSEIASVVQRDDWNGLTVFPAFSEGKTAAYMTTEVWQNFDAVWLQPLYIPVGGPPDSRPIFGVDAGTRFYSPFWQIIFFTPPAGKIFKSAKEVLDSGAALRPGPGKFCAITRDETLFGAQAKGAAGPVRPLTNEPVGAPGNDEAYVDGELVWFIDLGGNRFTWAYDTLVVDETPLFAFARADGTPLDLPKVGGTGPWKHPSCDGRGNCAGVVNNTPQFGALWRLWNVLLPDAVSTGLDVYVPSSQPTLRTYVQSQGFAATVPAFDDAQYSMRVALDGKSCFAAGTFPACKWLDSQNAIEGLLPDWRTTKTGTDVACPLVLFNGKAIGP
jgi:hypothetical protein